MRDVLNFNGGWEFSKDNKDFKPVTLPHTWNGVDGQDGGNDYYRGKCCYKNRLQVRFTVGRRVLSRV
ncbi:MAG: hypothetical protein ACLR6O_06380 [Eubacterium sp.]